MFVEVVLKNVNRDFDKKYVYKVPKESVSKIKKGCLVKVPFGNRNKMEYAIVIDIVSKDKKFSFNIKELKSVKKENISLSDNMTRLLEWMVKRYFCTYYDVLKLMLPLAAQARKKTMKTAILLISPKEAMELLQTNEIDNIRYVRVLEALLEYGDMPVSELANYLSISRSVFKTLQKKGYIRIADKRYDRNEPENQIINKSKEVTLNQEQKKIVDSLSNLLYKQNTQYLYGITGSGKTEVYLRLIEKVIKKNKTALVLVPEIALTPQMVNILSSRFGKIVSIIHSRMSIGERFDSWNRIEKGQAKIVIGARSAIFAPINNIGLIVIDEEHEYSYKSEIKPKYNVKEVAQKISIMNDCLLLLVSATPLVETFYKCKKDSVVHYLTKRAKDAKVPEVTLVDMKTEIKTNPGVISKKLIYEVKKTIERKEKVMILLNRRGYNNIFLCADCGSAFHCINCSVTMKYHKKENRLVCHQCGYSITPHKCQECSSDNIKGIGFGTELLEENLKKIFPNVPILRMDTDTTAKKDGTEKLLREFKKGDEKILIGTQMIAKGHDIEKVTLVGVLSADMMLETGDFRSGERTFSLLTQVIGRAGRGKKPGKAVIQTFNTDSYSILDAIKQDYLSFYNNEIKLRKIMKYPPYCHIGIIELRGEDKKIIDNFAKNIKREINELDNITCIGPNKPYIAYLSNKHRLRFVLKAKKLKKLVEVLTDIDQGIGKKIRKSQVILILDINPYNML